jgi:hypothetical protein
MKLRTKIILAVVGITSTIYFYKCYKDYYAEYDLVKKELNKIEDIKIVSIEGNSDLELEVYSATIELKDGGILSFVCDGAGKGFKDSKSLDILRINHWYFNGTGCLQGSHWGTDAINLGELSDYTEIRKLNIRNIRDAIEHFAKINNLLNNISTYPDFDTLLKKSDTLFFQKYDSRKIHDRAVFKSKECK